MKQVWLRGANGVGKSTLGRILEERLKGSVFVSSGSLLRQRVGADMELKGDMAKGDLAKSDLVLRVMHERYNEIRRSGGKVLILDGFPRKVEELHRWIKLTRSPDVVVSLELREDEIIERLVNRRICDKCGRSYNSFSSEFLRPILPRIDGRCDTCSDGMLVRRPDDDPETIRKRLLVFQENEEQTMNELQRHSRIEHRRYNVADGLASFKRISNDISNLIR